MSDTTYGPGGTGAAMATAASKSTPSTAGAPAARKPRRRYTLADLERVAQPWDDTRYEIIDGELFVASQPSDRHQYTSHKVGVKLDVWNEQTGTGFVLTAPGLLFADDDNTAPDVVWVSRERYQHVLGDRGKMQGPPELVVEVLSPGAENERRDREAKLLLYSRRGVDEYWLIDEPGRRVEVYRRDPADPGMLRLAAVVGEDEAIESPLLPGFAAGVAGLFMPEVH